jgi:hypothetical protein
MPPNPERPDPFPARTDRIGSDYNKIPGMLSAEGYRTACAQDASPGARFCGGCGKPTG